MYGLVTVPVGRRSVIRGLAGIAALILWAILAAPALGALTEQSKLSTPGSSGLGTGVALSSDGNTALVGGSEVASVFVRTGTSWSQQAKLTPPAGTEVGSSDFGHSVALSADGNTALVGGEDDNGNLGAVWVFVRSGTGWSEQQKLVGPGSGQGKESASGLFGDAVSLSANGNIALIGGPGNSSKVGAAWIWTRAGSTWTEQEKLVPFSGEETGAGQFGSSVALSGGGTTALIGAFADNGTRGAAWTFTGAGDNWEEGGELKAPTSGPDASIGSVIAFGLSVALSGNGTVALIGAPGDGGVGFINPGAAWSFTLASGIGTVQAKLIAPTSGANYSIGYPDFGQSVGLSEDGATAVIGGASDGTTTNPGHFQGAAWVATRTGASWSVQPKLTAPVDGPDAESGDGDFGASAALSANAITVLVGGSYDDLGVGAAWAFANPPAVSGVAPPSGPAGGGTPVTITGTRFTGAIAVSFGGSPAVSFSVVSDTQIDAIAPPGPAAPVDVVVTTPAGASSTSLEDRFTYFPSPPGAPSAVRAAAGNRAAIVSFAAAPADGSGITGYRVVASPGGASATGTGSPITVNGLSNGTRYTFTVTATNGLGTGPPSSPSNSVVPVAPPPTVSHVSISGAGKRKPKLEFTVTAGKYAAALKSVAVTAPAGLKFSSSRRSESSGITVTDQHGKRTKFSSKVSRGVLTITLRNAASKFQVKITSDELTASKSFASKVKHRRAGKVSFGFTVSDSGHVTTKLKSSDKIS